MPETTPAELARSLRAGERVSVLDLRDRNAADRWGIEGRTVETAQVPHVRFVASHATGDVRDPLPDLPEPVLVVCARGEASRQVAEWLRAAGVDASNLTGGTTAYAETLLAESLPADLTVRQYQRPATGCLSYLLADDGEAVVIDPLRAHTDRYLTDAADLGVDLRWVADTHVHADHLSGRRAIADQTDARELLPAGATDRGVEPAEARLLSDGDEVVVGDATLRTVATPGHTQESIAFHCASHLFAGDTLFLQGVGRPDLVGDETARPLAEALYDTLCERIFSLPSDTTLAPGHAADVAHAVDSRYTASLGELRELPLVGLDLESFVERVLAGLPPKPANHEAILAANLGHTTPDEEEAFELELGPNHCAVTAE